MKRRSRRRVYFQKVEMDEETGLYYYGARYLDPKYSRWLSSDPALNDYIPTAPVDDKAKKHNENLPGMGGVFNVVNLHLYHYAGNNPVKYTDPDGDAILAVAAIGFLIGAAVETGAELYTMYQKTGKIDVTQLDARKIGIQGLSGMASSLLYMTGAGIGFQIAGNSLINTFADIADQLTDNKKGVDGWKVLSAGISGAIAGLIGGKGNRQIGAQLSRMNKRILNGLKHHNFTEIGKAIAYFQKNTGTLVKQFNRDAIKDALKDFLPGQIRDDVIDEIIQQIKNQVKE